MRRRFVWLLVTVAGLAMVGSAAGAEGLDWEVRESASPGVPVRALRNARDGVLTFGDAWFDANSSLFGEFSLVAAKVSMGASDLVGLLDDNPLTQHVTKGVLSKNLAKMALLWHTAGAESVLGGHGMETERWATGEIASLNPLLSDEDVDVLSGPMPLDPLAFVGEGLLHDEVYRTHSSLLGVGSVVAADLALRPVAGLLRIIQLPAAGDAVEDAGNDLVRRAAKVAW